ncbi:MAG TPA: MFS transporter [Candidatus Saccharimonadales bacterium]|nr:MFS transporter [Candidatus Saccharimonadales bacterium]
MTKRQRLTLITTIIGSGIVILDGTIVNLALPKIASGLHANFAGLQWVVDGYLLSLSALILLGGSLGDIFGRKRTYLLGLIGFGAASLVCGLAVNDVMLVLTRILQGIFGALLVPGGLAVINTNFDRSVRGAAIGAWSAWSAIFAAIGPLLGGYILGIASWRWIFFINVPLVAICFVIGSGAIDESHGRTRRVDILGACLAALSLAGLTYGLIEGPAAHWPVKAYVAIAAGVVAGSLFVWHELHSKAPMVDFALFRSRNFTGSNIMTFMMYGALGGFTLALVVYLQTGLHYSAIKAGVSLLPLTILLFLFSKRIGALAGRIGPRLFMTLGPIIAGLGMLMLLGLHPGVSYLSAVLPGVIVFAAGMTLLVAPLTTTVMTSVEDENSGIASGINNAVARIGGLLVVAVLGLLGPAHVFRFGMILGSSLAILAGLVSWFTIQNKPVS